MGRQYVNIKNVGKVLAPIPNHIMGLFDAQEDLWISEDFGVSWIEKTTLGTVTAVKSFAFVTANDIVCGCNAGYVAVSHDKGDTWTVTKPFTGIVSRNGNCVRTFGNSVVICGDDETPNLYVGFSPDKGDTWYNLSADILAVNPTIRDYDYCYLLSETKMFFCSDGGDIIKVIYDGVGNFTATNMGDVGSKCTGIRSVSDTEHYFTTAAFILFHTADDFVSWTTIHDSDDFDELPRGSNRIGCSRLVGFYDNKLYHNDITTWINGWTFNVLTSETLTLSKSIMSVDNELGNNTNLFPSFMLNKDVIFQYASAGCYIKDPTLKVITALMLSRDGGQTWTVERMPAKSFSQGINNNISGSVAAFNIDTNKSINL